MSNKKYFNRTEKALIGTYGISSNLARKIAFMGTVEELKKWSDSELNDHGLNSNEIKRLKNGSRPPIQTKIVNSLCYNSRYQCVICHHTSFIIHHIVEWNICKNHEIDNLVLLCPNCHDQAHTKAGLTKSLSKDFIIDARDKHYNEINKHRMKVYLGNLHSKNHTFWYINIQRIIETFYIMKHSIEKVKNYAEMLSKNYISLKGDINYQEIEKTTHNEKYFIKFKDQLLITEYLRAIVEETLNKQHYILLHKYTSLTDFKKFYVNKSLLLYQGNIFYEPKDKKNPNEMIGSIQIKNINFTFEYETFYTLGNSASIYLKENYKSAVLLQIMSINGNNIKCRIYFISEDGNEIREI